MKELFASQGICELVETGYAEPVDATTLAAFTVAERDQLKSDRKKDARALFFSSNQYMKVFFHGLQQQQNPRRHGIFLKLPIKAWRR